jgi:hypothetical protein
MLNCDRCRLRVPAELVRSSENREWFEAEAHPFRSFQASQMREAFIARLRGDV